MGVYKAQASRLRSRLKSAGIDIPVSLSLEAVAAVHDKKTWDQLSVLDRQENLPSQKLSDVAPPAPSARLSFYNVEVDRDPKGTPEHVAEVFLRVLPTSTNCDNPGATYFLNVCRDALTVVVAALQRAGEPYHATAVAEILACRNGELPALHRQLIDDYPDHPATLDLSRFLGQFHKQEAGPEGLVTTLDVRQLRNLVGGIAWRLSQLGTGVSGR